MRRQVDPEREHHAGHENDEGAGQERKAPQDQQRQKGGGADREARHVPVVIAARDGAEHDEGIAGNASEAERVRQLSRDDCDGEAESEAAQHGPGDETRQSTEPQRPGDDEEGARQKHRADGERLAMGLRRVEGDRSGGGRENGGRGRGRGHNRITRAAERGIGQQTGDRREQAVLRRKPGDGGIGHGLGQKKSRDRKARDQVIAHDSAAFLATGRGSVGAAKRAFLFARQNIARPIRQAIDERHELRAVARRERRQQRIVARLRGRYHARIGALAGFREAYERFPVVARVGAALHQTTLFEPRHRAAEPRLVEREAARELVQRTGRAQAEFRDGAPFADGNVEQAAVSNRCGAPQYVGENENATRDESVDRRRGLGFGRRLGDRLCTAPGG